MENFKFGKTLETLRRENGLTQQELAFRTGLSQARICQWERDASSPNCDALLRLSRFFDVTSDFLLGEMDARGDCNVRYKELNDEQQMLVHMWNGLSRTQRNILFDIMREWID